MKDKGIGKVVIGYDCRYGRKMFAEASAQVFGTQGIKAEFGDDFVFTEKVGKFAFDREDLHISQAKNEEVIKKGNDHAYNALAHMQLKVLKLLMVSNT